MFIGPKNCVAICGFSFAFALRLAERYRVRIYRIGTRKRVIDAADFLAAVRRHAIELHPTVEPMEELTHERLEAILERQLTDDEMRARAMREMGLEYRDAQERLMVDRLLQDLEREYLSRSRS